MERQVAEEDEYYLEEIDDEPVPLVEKPKSKKQMSEKQLANLAKGRDAMVAKKTARLATAKADVIPPPPALKRNDPPLPKKKKKAQRIIIQNDSSSESDDEPTIVIRNSRKRSVEKPPPSLPEPVFEPEFFEPTPVPFRLKRV